MYYTRPTSRVARIVVPGFPHHVTQRGSNGQEVFFVEDDRMVYLDLLERQAQTFLSKAERMLGRRLRSPYSIGRPPQSEGILLVNGFLRFGRNDSNGGRPRFGSPSSRLRASSLP